MPRPTAVRRVNAKMRKRTVLSTLCGTFRWAWNFDCQSESFCGSRWELDYFRSALVVLVFESCWVLQQQQQPFDQSSTGLWREKLDKRPASCSRVFCGVSLSFRQEFEYLLGFIDHWEIKSKPQQWAVTARWPLTAGPGRWSLVAELSSKFVPWVFRFEHRCAAFKCDLENATFLSTDLVTSDTNYKRIDGKWRNPAMSIIEYQRICIRGGGGISQEEEQCMESWVCCMQLQLQLMLWPTLVLLLPDLNGRAVIKFISHARKQNKLHLKFKLRDCKSRYYGIIAKLQLPAKCSHDGQIAAVTVCLTAERAATAAEHVLCPQSVKIIERLFGILLWNTRYTSIAFNCE